MTCTFIQMPNQEFQRDENKLLLYCADQLVGTCIFDLASYIGKTQEESAHIVPADSDDTGIVLKGDTESYPGAFIEFRASVTRKAPKPPVAADSASAAGSQSNSKPATEAQNSGEDSKNNALSSLLTQKM